MKIIAVANHKGGAGKTTTSICLAQELQRRGYQVLLVDTDMQRNASTTYGVRPQPKVDPTICNILYSEEGYDPHECVVHTKYGDIIAGDRELADAPNRIPADLTMFHHLKRGLDQLREDYDYIIIDTPPAIGIVLRNVMAAADEIIIPLPENGYAIDGLMDFFEEYKVAIQYTNQNLKILGILIVSSEGNTNMAQDILQATSILGDKMRVEAFQTKIRKCIAVNYALTKYHVPLHEYDATCNASIDYQNFVDEMLDKEKKLSEESAE